MDKLIVYPDHNDHIDGIEIPVLNGKVSRIVSAVAQDNIPDALWLAEVLNDVYERAGPLADIEVGDFVHIEYTSGSGRISGPVTKIWPGYKQIQLKNGWCFHPGDKILQHKKRGDDRT